ncbi:MAG TPA: hypothetical protein VFG99_06785, partial [Chloroflexia bacterium]|nr:hypothetical protein [Chloroflexia bacterium]
LPTGVRHEPGRPPNQLRWQGQASCTNPGCLGYHPAQRDPLTTTTKRADPKSAPTPITKP